MFQNENIIFYNVGKYSASGCTVSASAATSARLWLIALKQIVQSADASGSWLLLLKRITFVYIDSLSQPPVFGEVWGIERGIKSRAFLEDMGQLYWGRRMTH